MQAEKQRLTLKPLTVAADIRKPLDATLTVPLRNTFDRPVTATVSWSLPKDMDQDQEPLILAPVSGSINIAPGNTGELVFRVEGKVDSQSDMPRAIVQFSHKGRPVFRRSVPVRAVPQLICKRVDSAPKIDGQLDDPAWASVGGLKASEFFTVKSPRAKRPKIKMTIARDDDNLYFAYDYTGYVSRIERKPHKRDSHQIHSSECVQLLIDTTGAEQQYKQFAATLGGGLSKQLMKYNSFAGHFRRSHTNWSAKWTVGTATRENGYSVEIAIPLKALGRAPKPGDVWRMNIVVQSPDSTGKATVSSWSSPESAFHLPRQLGVLFGTMKFE